MRESILVVACRPHCLRLLRLTSRMQVTGAAAIDLPPEAGAEETAARAAVVVAEQGLAADRVILGVSAHLAVLRRLRFPFTGRAKIDLVLGPEFEPHLAQPLAETALAWVKTALEPPPAAVALAAAYPLPELTALVEAFAAKDLTPDAACLDVAGLDAAVPALAGENGAVLIVGVESLRVDFACRLDGKPAVWRALPFAAAEADPLAAFLGREAVLTLSALAARPDMPLRLVLAAEDLPPSARAALAEAVGIEPVTIDALPGWPTLPDGSPLPVAYAAAYGLARLGASPGSLNFLRGSLAPGIPRSVLRRGLLVAGGSLAVLMMSAALSLGLAYHRLDAALATTQARTAALVEQAAPDAPPGLGLAQKLSILRGRLAERDAALRGRGPENVPSILEMLAVIHQGLGQGGRVRVRRIAADDRRVTIDATADDYNTVDEVKRRLAGSALFSDVEIRGAKNVPDKKQVEFQLDLGLAGAKEPSS